MSCVPPHWTAAYVGRKTLHVEHAEQIASAVGTAWTRIPPKDTSYTPGKQLFSDVLVHLETMKLPAKFLVHGRHTVFCNTLHFCAR